MKRYLSTSESDEWISKRAYSLCGSKRAGPKGIRRALGAGSYRFQGKETLTGKTLQTGLARPARQGRRAPHSNDRPADARSAPHALRAAQHQATSFNWRDDDRIAAPSGSERSSLVSNVLESILEPYLAYRRRGKCRPAGIRARVWNDEEDPRRTAFSIGVAVLFAVVALGVAFSSSFATAPIRAADGSIPRKSCRPAPPIPRSCLGSNGLSSIRVLAPPALHPAQGAGGRSLTGVGNEGAWCFGIDCMLRGHVYDSRVDRDLTPRGVSSWRPSTGRPRDIRRGEQIFTDGMIAPLATPLPAKPTAFTLEAGQPWHRPSVHSGLRTYPADPIDGIEVGRLGLGERTGGRISPPAPVLSGLPLRQPLLR